MQVSILNFILFKADLGSTKHFQFSIFNYYVVRKLVSLSRELWCYSLTSLSGVTLLCLSVKLVTSIALIPYKRLRVILVAAYLEWCIVITRASVGAGNKLSIEANCRVISLSKKAEEDRGYSSIFLWYINTFVTCFYISVHCCVFLFLYICML